MVLKAMSLNVRCAVADDGPNGWEFRKDSAARLIREFSPDIAGLQEAYDLQNRDLLARMPEFRMIGVGRDDGGAEGEFNPIFYRPDRFEIVDHGTFWLSERPGEAGSIAWGARLPRICTWGIFQPVQEPGVTFAFFNLHLDHESRSARENGVSLVLERIPKGIPTIVSGDFNAGESNLAVARMREAGLRDTYRVVHPDEPEPGTYHGFDMVGQDGKIDYLWVSDAWRVPSADILRQLVDGRPPSDHFAVVATVESTDLLAVPVLGG